MSTLRLRSYVVLGGDTPIAFKSYNEAKNFAEYSSGYVTEKELTREEYIEYTWENVSEIEWEKMVKNSLLR